MRPLLTKLFAALKSIPPSSIESESTQGVLANKFPISIRTQTQGQYRCQKVRNILKNHLPVSDFATMLLNLRKTQKSRNFCKTIFFFGKNGI